MTRAKTSFSEYFAHARVHQSTHCLFITMYLLISDTLEAIYKHFYSTEQASSIFDDCYDSLVSIKRICHITSIY